MVIINKNRAADRVAFHEGSTETQDTTLKECPFPQLSTVEAGGSTAFIYANFSVPVVEVNNSASGHMSSNLQFFFCLELHFLHLTRRFTHILWCSCQNAQRSERRHEILS